LIARFVALRFIFRRYGAARFVQNQPTSAKAGAAASSSLQQPSQQQQQQQQQPPSSPTNRNSSESGTCIR
jgi:hypothetical protein